MTTLAAHAYRGAGDLFTCVLEIVRRMPNFIEDTATGWRVENPVQPAENIADRWSAAPSKAKKFFAWLGDLQRDLDEAASGRGLDHVVARLSASFGEDPVRKAATRVGQTALADRQSGVLKMTAGTGMLGRTTGTRVPRHDFFGENRIANDLNPAKQAVALRAAFPSATVTVRPSGLTWVGRLQPTALSLVYAVRIEYDIGKRPRVTVIDPPLEPPPGDRIRHVFDGERLCLHYPQQWSGEMWIARSVVAWTSEYLLYHELLRATGQWLGGGHEPPSRASSSSRRSE